MADGLLTEARLREALGTRPFRLVQQTGSTNDLARQWSEDGAPAGEGEEFLHHATQVKNIWTPYGE